jgi:hypothetical protein
VTSAGRSARTEYQRRRARDRKVIRRNLRFTIPVIVFTPVVVYLAVRLGVHLTNSAFEGAVSKSTKKPSHTPIMTTGLANLVAIVLATAATMGLAAEFWGRRSTTESWRKGAQGEERLGQLLDGLQRHCYVVLHDLAVPGSSANIDHLVIGPTGVWVIDAKNYNGRLTWSKGTLWHGRYPLTKKLGVSAWEADSVATALGARVIPILCVLGASLPQPQMRVDGVLGISGGQRLWRVIQ